MLECMLVPLIEHTAAAAGRIVQRCAPLGIEDPDHKLNDASGRVELAGFLACRVSEFADQVLVCGTKQVRKFKILIKQAVFVEVAEVTMAEVTMSVWSRE
jgi:hypothetical protein